MYETADWSHQAEHIWDEHHLTPEEANEALADPERVVFNPDPASKSGRGIRIVGYSATARTVLCVLVVDDKGTVHGATAFPASGRYLREYKGEN